MCKAVGMQKMVGWEKENSEQYQGLVLLVDDIVQACTMILVGTDNKEK